VLLFTLFSGFTKAGRAPQITEPTLEQVNILKQLNYEAIEEFGLEPMDRHFRAESHLRGVESALDCRI